MGDWSINSLHVYSSGCLRLGRMLEGLRLCRALWRGEAMDWDGRWTVRQGVLGPTPHRPGGPPIW